MWRSLALARLEQSRHPPRCRSARRPGAVLAFYRALLHIRRTSIPLREGTYRPISAGDDVLAYARATEQEQVVVLLNLAGAARDAALESLSGWRWRVMLSSHARHDEAPDPGHLQLRPFEALRLAHDSPKRTSA